MKFLLLVLLVALVAPTFADINRCGAIQDNRTVYKDFYDPSNGHNILEIRITANNGTSGFVWQDIVDDNDKWDDNEPWIFCEVSIAGGAMIAAEAERRGDWSMESELPSLKVEFLGKGIKYKDMDRLLLNKHPHDPTRVKNKLSYELLQQVDNLSSLYTHFVHLYVNDESYGLYTLVEDLRDDMMKTHNLKKTSNLYKANNVFWSLAEDENVKQKGDTGYDKKLFEKNWDIRGEENHTVLIKAYTDIFNPNMASNAVMEGNFNVDNFATWLAFVILSGNNDLVFNNFGVYAPKESAKCPSPPLYMMAWDNDGAWSEVTAESIGETFTMYDEGVQYFWNSRLVQRFLQIDSYVDMLTAKMTAMVAGPLSPANIKSITDAYKPIIRPLLIAEPDKDHLAWGGSIENWEEYIDAMSQIPTKNLAKHATFLTRPMPVDAFVEFSSDASSVLFYWQSSYILKNLPFYYELQVATDKEFKQMTTKVNTNNTFIAVSTVGLTTSTVYYWRLLIHNLATPDNYMTARLSNYEDTEFGFANVTSPSSFGAAQSASVATLAEPAIFTSATGEKFEYALLDGVSHTATSGATCSSTPVMIPEGWIIAPNDALTKDQIKELKQPWGGAEGIVLADGTRVTPAGAFIDGFAEPAHHVYSVAVTGGQAYSARCDGNNHILLTKSRVAVQPTSAPTLSPPTPTTPGTPTTTPTTPTDGGNADGGVTPGASTTGTLPEATSASVAVVASLASVLAFAGFALL